MPKVQDDGVVRDVIGNVFFSLKPLYIKRPLGRRRKSALGHNFKISGLFITHDAIWLGIIEKLAKIHWHD